MGTLLALIKKEFKQIFRNKGMLPIIFVMPVIQLIILANAASYEVNNIDVTIIDQSGNNKVTQFANEIGANNYFTMKSYVHSYAEGLEQLDKGNTDALIIFNSDYAMLSDMSGKPAIQLIINTIDGASAGVIVSYLTQFITQFEQSDNLTIASPIDIEYTNKFNLKLDYKAIMIPGILVVLVSMIGLFLTSMNIARENEIGTIDQLNVSPLKKYHFILGKLLPMLIIGLGELAFGLVFAHVVYNIPFLGNPLTIFIFAIAFLFVMLSLGLLISTQSDSQQQAMLVAYLFLIIFIMFSGLFTALDSMPNWAKSISQTIPITHFITVMRSVMLKGTPIKALIRELVILLASGSLVMSFALWRYKKVR